MIRHHEPQRRRLAVVDLQGLPSNLTPSRFKSVSTQANANTPGTVAYVPPIQPPAPAPATPATPGWLGEINWHAWAGTAAALIAVYEFARRRYSR